MGSVTPAGGPWLGVMVSGTALGTVCRFCSNRGRLQCLCADLATQAWCQITERDRSSELLFLSLYVVVFVLPLQGMSPSSSNIPEICRSASSMREVTRPCCHPGTGRVPQLPVSCGESVSPSGLWSSGRGAATMEPVPAQLAARDEGPSWSHKCLWQERP